MATGLHLGTTTSREKRLLRAFLHREVAAGASLGDLLESDHPAIGGVRCFALLQWMPYVKEYKATRMLRGMPGHLRFAMLSSVHRAVLLERVRSYEERRQR